MRIIFVMVLLLLGASAHADRPKHQFKGMCIVCHLVVPESPDDDLSLDLNVNATCQMCHQSPIMGHPFDVTPISAEIPDGFNLLGGRLFCPTCHTPCGDDDDENPYMLRGDLRNETFCSNCHSNSIPLEKKHYGISGIAHPRSTEPVEGNQSPIDDITMICLSCHSFGGMGPSADITIGDTQEIGHSHSVGVDFKNRAIIDRELKSYASVSKAVVLREGKVGCLSCHNIYSKVPPMLALNNAGSSLCLTCHDK